jgi:hypothetical protein
MVTRQLSPIRHHCLPRSCLGPPPGRRPACRLSSVAAAAPAPPVTAATAPSTGWAPHTSCAMPSLQVVMLRSHCLLASPLSYAQPAQQITCKCRMPLTDVPQVSSGAVEAEGQMLVLNPLLSVLGRAIWKRRRLKAGQARFTLASIQYIDVFFVGCFLRPWHFGTPFRVLGMHMPIICIAAHTGSCGTCRNGSGSRGSPEVSCSWPERLQVTPKGTSSPLIPPCR